jgi:hypothetical protein
MAWYFLIGAMDRWALEDCFSFRFLWPQSPNETALEHQAAQTAVTYRLSKAK